MFKRFILSVVVFVCALSFGAQQLGAYAKPRMSEDNSALYKQAVQTALDEDYAKAHSLAVQTKDPGLIKIIEWIRLTDTKNIASFEDLTAFMKKNKGWPRIYVIRRNAEKAAVNSGDKKLLTNWFKKYPPVSAAAVMAYADMMLEKKEWEVALPMLHRLWINMTPSEEEAEEAKLIEQKLAFILDEKDYAEKTKRLLDNKKVNEAKQLLPKLSPEARKIAEARIALIRNAKDAKAKLKKAPDAVHEDPGFIFDQIRWYRRNKKYDQAVKLLKRQVSGKSDASKWWAERSVIIRQFLNDGRFSDAYKLAEDHRLSSGEQYADAEWLAGWIALRFKKEKEGAVFHFSKMLASVKSPVSIARGEYWLGRTHEELGNPEDATEWYARAAKKFTTIYGQLAAEKSKKDKLPDLPENIKPTEKNLQKIRNNELFSIMQILQKAEAYELSEVFALRLYALYQKPEEIVALAHLMTEEAGRPDMAVTIARRARQNGIYLGSLGYPVLDIPEDSPTEQAVLLSIIRQESSFSSHVVSPAGARGLMQIMPSTAKQVAQKKKKKFAPEMLTENPEFNIEVGSAYFSEMVKRFGGSYILAIAAYNAGPTNVRRWIKAIGNPEDEDIDPIDWIEMIPFNETRNYVQRVLENLHIYRRHLNYPEAKLSSWKKD